MLPAHDTSEDLFRALFGGRRGIPKGLVLTDPRTYDKEVDEMIHNFATRPLGAFGHESEDWVARGEWMGGPFKDWQGFLSHQGMLIAIRSDDEILFSKDLHVAPSQPLRHCLDICEETSVKIGFASLGKMLAVERAVLAERQL